MNRRQLLFGGFGLAVASTARAQQQTALSVYNSADGQAFVQNNSTPFTPSNGGLHINQCQQTTWSLGTMTVNMDGEQQESPACGVLYCKVCGAVFIDLTKITPVVPGSNSVVVSPQAGNQDAQ